MSEHHHRITHARRNLLVLGVSAATVFGGLTLSAPAIAQPKPTLDEVRDKVDELDHLAGEANERFNAATELLAEIERRLDRARNDVERQQVRLEELSADMGGFAAATYRAGGIDPTVQALFADDPADFLARASIVDAFAAQQTEQLGVVATQRQNLEQRKLVADEELGRQDAVLAVLAEEKKTLDDLVAEQKELLAELTAEEQARLAREREQALSRSSSEPSIPAIDVPASGRAAIAVKAALSKLGYPYVYGGKGPDSFDCSGFTSWAWRQAGVSLSSSSSAQANQGTRVSVSALQPGDILFYGSPVSHVAMYIGNGQVVHASNPRTDVLIAP
ncbi:MAG TPA: NlpC/P60 family protein, partial [Jiangellaceae bacterium]|nr:NlpC/P60 family protein [Jiangellaceae bacterium]